MVGGKPRREGSQKRAIRRLRDRDHFYRLFIGACRASEVLDGRLSQHADPHELLARKLHYPRRSGCVSPIDQRTKLGVVPVASDSENLSASPKAFVSASERKALRLLARFQHCAAAMYSEREKPLPAPNSNVFTGHFVRGLCARRRL